MKIKLLLLTIVIVIIVSTAAVWAWQLYSYSRISPEIAKGITNIDLNNSGSFDKLVNSTEFKKSIKNSTIIGFGEATHGTIEFRKAFIELAKSLITNKRINIVVFSERDFSQSWQLNDYVLNPLSDITPALALPYSSQLEREFIAWVRQYNLSQSDAGKIWLAGADIYSPKYAAFNALVFIKENKINLPQATIELLQEISSLPLIYTNFKQEKSLQDLLYILKPLEDSVHKRILGSKTTLKEKWFLNSIFNLPKSIEFIYTAKHKFRDIGMFDNVKFLKDIRPGASMLLHAHNSHIEKVTGNTFSIADTRMGWLLYERYPKEYFAIATDADKGSYRSGINGKIFEIPESGNKIGYLLANATPYKSGYINLSHSDKIKQFFNEDHYITHGVLDSDLPTYPLVKNFSKAYDAAFWIQTSTPLVVSGINEFVFFFIKTKQKDAILFNAKSINFKGSYDFVTFNDERSKLEVPTVNMAFFKNKKLIKIQNQYLKANKEKSFNVTYPIPPLCDSLTIFINGNNVRQMHLSKLLVNEVPLNLKSLYFDGSNYKREVGNDGEINVSLKP